MQDRFLIYSVEKSGDEFSAVISFNDGEIILTENFSSYEAAKKALLFAIRYEMEIVRAGE